ncbi:hypothetical protein [Niveibacterium sp. COAC-50]|uniref:hypothetical protein n=1 Tax=Niveibacterium sp. COAC-50 TaxID=2729384 RepID=UPI001558137F|nr:hypothetical protein [Niveibacterium sp. COAC-50]
MKIRFNSLDSRSRQVGISLVAVLLVIAVLVVIASGLQRHRAAQKRTELAKREELERKEVARRAASIARLSEQKDKVFSILAKWDDAVGLAKITTRSKVTGPVDRMQAIRREMGQVIGNDCINSATRQMSAGMDDAIFAFEMFVKYPRSQSASDTSKEYLDRSSDKIAAGTDDLMKCTQ